MAREAVRTDRWRRVVGVTGPTWLVDWARGALLGTVLGTLFLGIGGRVSMRGIAAVEGLPTGFSIGGSLTVVFLGALSGLAAGLIYVTSRKLIPRYPWGQRILFWVVFLAITLRGLRPLDARRLALFLPLFFAFGILLELLWRRRAGPARIQSAAADAA